MAPSKKKKKKRKAHYTHTKETGIKSWGSGGPPPKWEWEKLSRTRG